MRSTPCPLCQAHEPSRVILQTPQLRIVWGAQADHPCLVQVIWQAHATEMSHLVAPDQATLMHAVFAVESALQQVLAPKKINLASLGNWVAHVHWHIIPRWEDDAHWPNSIWATQQREPALHGVALKAALEAAIAAQFDVAQ